MAGELVPGGGVLDVTAFQRAVREVAIISISDAVRKASAEATSRTARQVVTLLQAFELGIGVDDRQPIWQMLADHGRDSVARSYVQTRRRGGPVGYRTTATNPANIRYAGGKLYAALRNPGFIRVEGDILRYGDTRILDREARQWRRLNFGALPNRGSGPGRFQVRWSNLVVASLGLTDDPRPPFSIPAGAGRRGYWTPSGEFYPAGEGPAANRGGSTADDGGSSDGNIWVRKRPTKGIVARNFLDAGLRRIAGEMGPAFRDMYVASFKNAESRARLTAGTGGPIPIPTRPPQFRVIYTRG